MTINSLFLKKQISGILILLLFVVYLSTICPTVYVGDSGELISAAFSLGIPHPSGYPLHSMIGKLFCLLPVGDIAFRMNLMSLVFGVLTVWLIYIFIYRLTVSRIAAFTSSVFMAFTPVVWAQTFATEVYSLHTFFMSLLFIILINRDEKKEFQYLALLSFTAGLSFCNHLQTIMLVPAFLFIIFTRSRGSTLNLKKICILSSFFIIALTLYLYLPVRTNAGPAIHWGEPNSIERFISHVTGESHRSVYVFNHTTSYYWIRLKDCLMSVWNQFGFILLFAIYGWVKLGKIRWKIFYILIIIFDFCYTIFLNTVSIEVTPFNLSTIIVITVLFGTGIAHLLQMVTRLSFISNHFKTLLEVACCMIPLSPLVFNYGLSNQSRNYTAYENVVNIFRTTDIGSSLIINGDNNLFPVAYGRIVEDMRRDVNLYDRFNIIFKMPYLGEDKFVFHGKWEDLCGMLEADLLENLMPAKIFYAEFNPRSISLPEQFKLVPFGILDMVVERESVIDFKNANDIWQYYNMESLNDEFSRDYMTRQLSAFFHMKRGIHLIRIGLKELGLKRLKIASSVAGGSGAVHNDLAIIYSDFGFFNEAKHELEKALAYYDNPEEVYNGWGYYYYKVGRFDKANSFFEKALNMAPNNYLYLNNLGFSLFKSGQREMAENAFNKSLSIRGKQGEIITFMKENGLEQDVR